jgi:hypothetical protein
MRPGALFSILVKPVRHWPDLGARLEPLYWPRVFFEHGNFDRTLNHQGRLRLAAGDSMGRPNYFFDPPEMMRSLKIFNFGRIPKSENRHRNCP